MTTAGRATTWALPASLAVLVVLGCGPGDDPDLEVGVAEAGAPVAGSAQVVVDVTNHGDGPDRLVGADTPAAIGVEVHVTEIDDGQAVMRELDEVEIPPGETVRFRPGGLHLMLVVPDETVAVGGTFELTLRFEHAGEVTVPVTVVELVDLADDPPGDPPDEADDR